MQYPYSPIEQEAKDLRSYRDFPQPLGPLYFRRPLGGGCYVPRCMSNPQWDQHPVEPNATDQERYVYSV